MSPINFEELPERLKSKLEAHEIGALNTLFADEGVQQRIAEIETYRQTRQRWEYGIYGGCTLLAIGLLFILEKWALQITFWIYGFAIAFLYYKFEGKIEIPLKSEVLSKMCPILYSKLEYSHDAKYSFDELEVLKQHWFLKDFTMIATAEDSVQFSVEKDGKRFFVNGFELETRTGSKEETISNHCYLMKAVFPSARIPLTSDLLIVTDTLNSQRGSRMGWFIFWWVLITGVCAILSISLLETTLVVGVLIGAILWTSIGFALFQLNEKKGSKNRVELENIEFERLFDVQCSDQVTSRMILNPAFMDRLVSFVRKTGNSYEFLLQNNVMYIKRIINGTYLESGTEKNILTNLSGFAQFYIDMREILSFCYDMNLMYLSKTDINILGSIDTNIAPNVPIANFVQKTPKNSITGTLFSLLQR